MFQINKDLDINNDLVQLSMTSDIKQSNYNI